MAANRAAAALRWPDEARRLARAAAEAASRALHGESVRLRAMALTYLSLFALVPALVVAFSVVQAFTGVERIADQVHEFFLDNLAVGARASLEPYLERFVSNAHTASAGLVGGALLVWSMISLFSNVDGAINDIWGIKRHRKLRDQAVTYWVGLTVGPLLLAGSIYLGHTTRLWLAGTGLGFLAVAGGVLLTCAFFATLYLLVPNTKVNLGAALGAGLVAGVAWELAKWGYAIAVTRVFRYHVIYGSVAVIPTFLLWLYVSWSIVLFGARIAFVVQNAPALWHGGPLADHPTTREALAARIMLEVALAFDAGAGDAAAPASTDLARSLRVQPEDVADVVDAMRTAGLLQGLASGGLVPARPTERISLFDVRQAVRGPAPGRPEVEPVSVDRALAEVETDTGARLAATSFRALCEEERIRRRREGGELGQSPDEAQTTVRA
jgi:membrane protein